jgi:hypothetical protein
MDYGRYSGAVLDEAAIRWAWESYFVGDVERPAIA